MRVGSLDDQDFLAVAELVVHVADAPVVAGTSAHEVDAATGEDHVVVATATQVVVAVLADDADAAVALAEQREQARGRRDFEEADRLRGELAALGWEVRDEADGFRLVPL